VKIIPIHGTKNLEGLITAEFATELGIKMGILTDATDSVTMAQRTGKKRSSEERQVIKVIQVATERGLPVPMSFGVPEDDMLFALPAETIRDHLKGHFPGWKELVAECRSALGKGPSDSVDWKPYALQHYGLPITTPGGVRDVVRKIRPCQCAIALNKRVVRTSWHGRMMPPSPHAVHDALPVSVNRNSGDVSERSESRQEQEDPSRVEPSRAVPNDQRAGFVWAPPPGLPRSPLVCEEAVCDENDSVEVRRMREPLDLIDRRDPDWPT
jgi:hypothetical protein